MTTFIIERDLFYKNVKKKKKIEDIFVHEYC